MLALVPPWRTPRLKRIAGEPLVALAAPAPRRRRARAPTSAPPRGGRCRRARAATTRGRPTPRKTPFAVAMPRCSTTARQRVGSATTTRVKPCTHGEEGADAAAGPGLLVGGEEERGVAGGCDARPRARQAAAPLVSHAPRPTARSSVDAGGRAGRRVQPGSAGTVSTWTLKRSRGAPRVSEQADAPVAEIGEVRREAGPERLDEEGEDAAFGVDGARRVPRVERHEALEQARGPRPSQSLKTGLMRAESVELWPKSLMKPSASVTPQSADCA